MALLKVFGFVGTGLKGLRGQLLIGGVCTGCALGTNAVAAVISIGIAAGTVGLCLTTSAPSFAQPADGTYQGFDPNAFGGSPMDPMGGGQGSEIFRGRRPLSAIVEEYAAEYCDNGRCQLPVGRRDVRMGVRTRFGVQSGGVMGGVGDGSIIITDQNLREEDSDELGIYVEIELGAQRCTSEFIGSETLMEAFLAAGRAANIDFADPTLTVPSEKTLVALSLLLSYKDIDLDCSLF